MPANADNNAVPFAPHPVRKKREGDMPTVPDASDIKGSEKASGNSNVSLLCPRSKIDVSDVVSRPLVPSEGKTWKPVPVSYRERTVTVADMLEDIRLRHRELPNLYPASAAALESVLKRVRKNVDQRWKGRGALGRFLADMGGPKRRECESVERLAVANPNYGPGLCIWADHRTQANNKTTTVRVYDPGTREWGPLSEVARQHGLKSNTVAKAIRRGASPEHVIAKQLGGHHRTSARGKRLLAGSTQGSSEPTPAAPMEVSPDPRNRWPWPLKKARHDEWETLYRAKRLHFPHGKEWRFEFALRHARQRRDEAQAECHALSNSWGGEPTSEEEAAYAVPERRIAYWARLVRDAEDALPLWSADIGGTPREDAPDDVSDLPLNQRKDYLRALTRGDYGAEYGRKAQERSATYSTGKRRVNRINLRRRPTPAPLPVPSYNAADLVPEAVEMHEDGFPMDDTSGRYFRTLAATMEALDAK